MKKDKRLENLEKGKWKPGQSGNPKGYKKGVPNAKTIIKKYYNLESPAMHPDTMEKLTYCDAAWMHQIKKAALEGDLAALKAITDRLEGTPISTQIVEGSLSHGLDNLTLDAKKAKLEKLLSQISE